MRLVVVTDILKGAHAIGNASTACLDNGPQMSSSRETWKADFSNSANLASTPLDLPIRLLEVHELLEERAILTDVGLQLELVAVREHLNEGGGGIRAECALEIAHFA